MEGLCSFKRSERPKNGDSRLIQMQSNTCHIKKLKRSPAHPGVIAEDCNNSKMILLGRDYQDPNQSERWSLQQMTQLPLRLQADQKFTLPSEGTEQMSPEPLVECKLQLSVVVGPSPLCLETDTVVIGWWWCNWAQGTGRGLGACKNPDGWQPLRVIQTEVTKVIVDRQWEWTGVLYGSLQSRSSTREMLS